jgi:hypothetical protein
MNFSVSEINENLLHFIDGLSPIAVLSILSFCKIAAFVTNASVTKLIVTISFVTNL